MNRIESAQQGRTGSRTLANSSVICGAVALVLSLLPDIRVASFFVGGAAIVLGILGVSRSVRGNRAAAIGGLALGILSVAFAIGFANDAEVTTTSLGLI